MKTGSAKGRNRISAGHEPDETNEARGLRSRVTWGMASQVMEDGIEGRMGIYLKSKGEGSCPIESGN